MAEKNDSLSPENAILVGKVSGVFGTRGWVKVFAYTRPRTQILTYDTWYLGAPPTAFPYRVVNKKQQGSSLVAQLDGITERDQALDLMQQEISISRADLAPVSDREFYWIDLIGLEVVNCEGQVFGLVRKMWETGANDVMEVRGEKTRLIPFVLDSCVHEVNLTDRRIVVDWHPDD